MGAFIPSEDGETKPGLGNQQPGQHYMDAYHAIPPPHGQYPHQLHQPYGYMLPVPPYQQHYPH